MSEVDQTVAVNRKLVEAGVLPAEELERPPIKLPPKGGLVAPLAGEIGLACSMNGVFLRDKVPMYLDKSEGKLEELTPDVMVTYADENLFLYRPKPVKNKDGEVVDWDKEPGSMSPQLAKLVLVAPIFLRKQRQIRRIDAVRMPVLRADGGVELLSEGYDRQSKILTLPSKIVYDESLSLEAAKAILIQFFKDFPFADRDEKTGMSRSLSVHVAAMLTPFCLGLLSPAASVPMFVYTANDQGSGKSILCKSALYPVQGTAGDRPFGADEEELRKQLDSAALSAESIVFFDNVKRKLTSSALDRWVTQPMWKGRYMGGQKGFEVEKQCVTFVSVNHVELDRDAMRRSLFVDLFIEDDVNDRRFEIDIDDPYLQRDDVRARLLSALWTLVRHWAAKQDTAGRRVEGMRQRAGFGEWSRVVAGIVNAAGFGDCLEPPKLARGDEETRDFRDMVEILAKRLVESGEQMESMTLDELLTICDGEELFSSKLDRGEGGSWKRPTVTWAGSFFKKQEGRRFKVTVGEGKNARQVTVRLGKRGSKNRKKYDVELV